VEARWRTETETFTPMGHIMSHRDLTLALSHPSGGPSRGHGWRTGAAARRAASEYGQPEQD